MENEIIEMQKIRNKISDLQEEQKNDIKNLGVKPPEAYRCDEITHRISEYEDIYAFISVDEIKVHECVTTSLSSENYDSDGDRYYVNQKRFTRCKDLTARYMQQGYWNTLLEIQAGYKSKHLPEVEKYKLYNEYEKLIIKKYSELINYQNSKLLELLNEYLDIIFQKNDVKDIPEVNQKQENIVPEVKQEISSEISSEDSEEYKKLLAVVKSAIADADESGGESIEDAEMRIMDSKLSINIKRKLLNLLEKE